MSYPPVPRAEEGGVPDDSTQTTSKEQIPEAIAPPVQKSETSSSDRISMDMSIQESLCTPQPNMSKREVKRAFPVRPFMCVKDSCVNSRVHMFKWLCFWILTIRFSQPPVPPAISIMPEVDVVEVFTVNLSDV